MRRPALLVIAASAPLVLAEAWARACERDVRLVDDGRLYAEPPEVHGANAGGFHERDLPDDPDGARRIAVLGDSLTWGTGTAEEAWTRAAEATLGAPWQVLNYGVYGYDTAQARAVLPVAMRKHPVAVVLAIYTNDVYRSRFVELGGRPVYVAADRLPFALGRLWQGARAARAVPTEDWDTFAEALRGIADDAAPLPVYVVGLRPHTLSRGANGCVRVTGDAGWCRDQGRIADHERVVVQEAGLPYLDIAPGLAALGNNAWFPVNADDREHYSVAGQAALGELVGRALAERLGG